MENFKFKRNVDIGNLDAIDDPFLLKAFIEKDDWQILKDIDSRKCILLGRTGTGKTAFIKYLEEKEDIVKRIEPETLSLQHLSNSTIIRYFQALNVKLDLFYKVLWRHVFIVELIKLRFDSELNKSQNILEWFAEQFKKDPGKQKAIKYLENWENHFWKDTEYRIKEIETSLEKKFRALIGGGVDELLKQFKINGSVEKESSQTKTFKSELTYKAQSVVNETQIKEIRDLLRILQEELFVKSQKKYFIVIDKLDEDWVDDTIVYELIKALIDTVKDFSRIPNVKIVIALRSNILKKIFHENKSRGVQREKYTHLYLHLDWNKRELENLINKRLEVLMRGQYTKKSPVVQDILPLANKKNKSGFDYILERTLMRPRDLIDFMNKAIKYSDGKTQISRETLRKAEDEYSDVRLQSINDEWNENFGNLHTLYSFLIGGPPSFSIENIQEHAKEYFLEKFVEDEHLELCEKFKDLFIAFSTSYDPNPLINNILVSLFEIGIIGIKLSPDQPIRYASNTYSNIKEAEFLPATKFYIHKMFYKSLRIQEK